MGEVSFSGIPSEGYPVWEEPISFTTREDALRFKELVESYQREIDRLSGVILDMQRGTQQRTVATANEVITGHVHREP